MNPKLLFLSAEASYYSLSRKLLLLVFPVSRNPLYQVNRTPSTQLFSIMGASYYTQKGGTTLLFPTRKVLYYSLLRGTAYLLHIR